jgi:AraC-like DNA-binding protein
MEYLLAWRMALAKDLLRREEAGIGEIAQRVGYGSASAFSVAFTRHVGLPPTFYAREQAAAAHADDKSNVLLPKTPQQLLHPRGLDYCLR